MAISKKPPKRNPPKKSTVDEDQIAQLINKGGSVAREIPQKAPKAKAAKMKVQLRLDADLVDRVDLARQQRLVAPSRHQWFLEAIAEKLEREGRVGE